MCVCVSVTTKFATYLVYMSNLHCRKILYDVFKVFVMWLSLKTPRSKVLASFADHDYLSHFLVSSGFV